MAGYCAFPAKTLSALTFLRADEGTCARLAVLVPSAKVLKVLHLQSAEAYTEIGLSVSVARHAPRLTPDIKGTPLLHWIPRKNHYVTITFLWHGAFLRTAPLRTSLMDPKNSMQAIAEKMCQHSSDATEWLGLVRC